MAPRLEPALTVKGNCFYNPTTKDISILLSDAGRFRGRRARKELLGCPRVLTESGQEFIRAGKSLPLPVRRARIGFSWRSVRIEGGVEGERTRGLVYVEEIGVREEWHSEIL